TVNVWLAGPFDRGNSGVSRCDSDLSGVGNRVIPADDDLLRSVLGESVRYLGVQLSRAGVQKFDGLTLDRDLGPGEKVEEREDPGFDSSAGEVLAGNGDERAGSNEVRLLQRSRVTDAAVVDAGRVDLAANLNDTGSPAEQNLLTGRSVRYRGHSYACAKPRLP